MQKFHRIVRYFAIAIMSLFFCSNTISCRSGGDKQEFNRPIRLVVTGDLKGTIKECRCPHGQPAGLARRKTIFDNIRKETPDAIFIECGILTDGSMRQWELILLSDLVKQLNYDIVCPYVVDLERLIENMPPMYKWTIPFRLENIWPRVIDFPEDAFIYRLKMIGHMTFDRNQQEIRVGTFTALRNCIEDKTAYDSQYYVVKNWNKYVRGFASEKYLATDLTVLICNWDYKNPDMPLIPATIYEDIPGLDIMIIGGSGNVEPEVEKQNDLLTVNPGIYGEYILVLDLWTENGNEISKFEWETIPTETVKPDSAFASLIDKTYKDRDKKLEK